MKLSCGDGGALEDAIAISGRQRVLMELRMSYSCKQDQRDRAAEEFRRRVQTLHVTGRHRLLYLLYLSTCIVKSRIGTQLYEEAIAGKRYQGQEH